jgi:hypothetical protein
MNYNNNNNNINNNNNNNNNSSSKHDLHIGLKTNDELNQALPPQTPPAVTAALLADSLFPPRKPKTMDEEESDSDSDSGKKKEDPLATQVWRLYTKAKDTLPNGSRLENLTWRMMAMTLNKKKKQEEADKLKKEQEMEMKIEPDADSPPPPDDTTSFLSSSAPPYMAEYMASSMEQQKKSNVMIYGSARASNKDGSTVSVNNKPSACWY